MKDQWQSGTQALIGAVRDRLWLQSAADALSRGVRIGSGIFLIGGLYHLFVQSLQARILFTLSLLPLAVGLVVVLFRHRPGLDTAARTADTWFDGKNLITSAWELQQRRGGHSSTDELVMARAQALAAQWRRRIAAEWPLRWPQRLTPPLLLALTGIFLLQLPSKEWLMWSHGPDHDQVMGRDSAAGNGVSQPGAEAQDSRVSASPREEINTASAPAPPSSQASPVASAADQAPLGAPQTGDMADNGEVNKPDAASPAAINSAASANDGGKQAGDQDGIRANRDITIKSPPLKVNEVGIQRAAGTQGIAGNGDELGDIQGQHAPALPDGAVIPAARHAQTRYRADYTPALRAYMARYFLELNAQVPQP